MELDEFLSWAAGPAGAGALGFLFVEYVPWAWVQARGAKGRRLVAFGASAAFAVAAYLLQIVLGYTAAPAGWGGWVGQLFLVATSAFGLATLIHTPLLGATMEQALKDLGAYQAGGELTQ